MVEMITLASRAEWLERRKSYIGGSECACLVGMNPYKTNVELWEQKTGRRKAEDISGNPYVQYGTNAEKHLRDLFQLDFPQLKVEYVENNMWVNSDFPFAHASLDGWLTDAEGRRGVLEIKTTTIQSPAQKAKWDGRIPDSYYCQIIHYLIVTGFEFAILKGQLRWIHDDGDVLIVTKHYRIERADVKDDMQILVEAEQKFIEYLVRDERPPLILPNV